MRRNLGPGEYPIQTQQHYKRPYTIATISPTLLPRITALSTVYKAHTHTHTHTHTSVASTKFLQLKLFTRCAVRQQPASLSRTNPLSLSLPQWLTEAAFIC